MPDLCNKASLAQRGIDKEFGHGRIQRFKPLLRPLLRNACGTLEVVEIHELTPQEEKVMSVSREGDQEIRLTGVSGLWRNVNDLKLFAFFNLFWRRIVYCIHTIIRLLDVVICSNLKSFRIVFRNTA